MMLHAFANVGRHGNSERALGIIHRALKGHRAVLGLAELDEADTPTEHALTEILFRGWRSASFRSRVPILDNIERWWKRVGSISVEGHPGIPRVSPGRLIVGVKYRHRVTGRKLARLNSHVVAGAFNAKDEHNDDQRRRFWEMWWDRLCEEVKALVADGYDVVVSFDGNRQRPPLPVKQLHPHARIVAHDKTDYIIAIPAAGHVVEVVRTWTEPLGIDFHRLLCAKVNFTRRGRTR